MFQTMTKIGNNYHTDARTVGKILYTLKIRDYHHPEQKGFPYEQAITHGVAKAFQGRTGETYYKYDITSIKEEFEAELARQSKSTITKMPEKKDRMIPNTDALKNKIHAILKTLNRVIETEEMGALYRLKSDIAEMYVLLDVNEG